MAKLLWESKPGFSVALVVRGQLILTSHTNCDGRGRIVIDHLYGPN